MIPYWSDLTINVMLWQIRPDPSRSYAAIRIGQTMGDGEVYCMMERRGGRRARVFGYGTERIWWCGASGGVEVIRGMLSVVQTGRLGETIHAILCYICRQFFVSPKSLHGLDCSLVRYSKQKKSINWKKVSLRSTKRIQELIAPCFCVENCSGVLQKKRSNIKEVMVQKQGKYSTF